MSDPSQQTDELLERLVERALELEDCGEPWSVDELCADAPHLADEVAAALGEQRRIDAWAKPFGDLIGQKLLQRYRVDAPIGAGAMGAVLRGHDLELKRDVAIKLLHPHLFGDQAAEARFLREGEVLATLRHPHVVAVHDRGKTIDGAHFVVMELLEGESLATRLEAGAKPSVRQAARWAADLADGLGAAHAAGIYHRDVKPSNIFITSADRAVLLDFGIASRRDEAGITVGDTTLGTPKYMPPEQAARETPPAPTLDVYSLSATLYHMVCGRAPYDGGVREVLAAVQRDDPPSPARLRPDLPGDLLAVLECGMAREPSRRYATAAELAADLRGFLEFAPIAARRRGPVARALYQVRRSRRWQVVLVAGAVAAVVGLVPPWLEARRLDRERQVQSLWSGLPPVLTFGGNPRVADEQLRAELGRDLDTLVELAPGDTVLRCYRAAFRWDHDDQEGAATDFETLAGRTTSTYITALAARYRAAALTGDAKPDLADLPEPVGRQARLVAGYHAVRARDHARSAALLSDPGNDLVAQELALLARFEPAVIHRDKVALLDLYQRCLRIEGAFGAQTTRTRYVMGTALVLLKRFEEAIEPLEDALTMVPDSYPGLNNLAIAYRRTWRLEDAERAIRRAITLRRTAAKPRNVLAKILTERQCFDAADAAAAEVNNATLRAEASGYAKFWRAVECFQKGETPSATAAAEQALTHFRSAYESGRGTLSRSELAMLKMNAVAARELVAADYAGFCSALCEVLQQQPRAATYVDNLADALPDEISPKLAQSLRRLLRSIASDSAQADTSPATPSSSPATQEPR
ncbi:MAG: serine/threonine-protein kinase [Planctomycetota bacterium]